jgi:periodic tryptophan protein 2
MKYSYRLKRICGSVYSNGNLEFTNDGNSVISPVGNRLNIFNLVNQTSEALPMENRKNIRLVRLSHNNRFLVSIDVEGNALFYNFPQRILLHRFNFRQKVYDLKFSPNDKYFAVTYGRGCQIWQTPNAKREFNPLVLNRTIIGHFDETTCLDWSRDSRSLAIGSKDLSARVYYRITSKFMAMSVLGGHRDEIIGVYFGTHNNEVYTIAGDGGVFSWKYEQDKSLTNVKKRKTTSVAKGNHEDGDYVSSSDGEGENSSDDSDDSSSSDVDGEEEDDGVQQTEAEKLKLVSKTGQRKGQWQLVERQLVRDNQGEVSCTAFNKTTGILVLGFANGVFGLYEMPGCTNIHRLSVSNSALNAININSTGEWLAIGAAELGQLLVWEWKSESYVLKQQGHLYGLNALDFSPEGQFIATGGEDGKVKVWNVLSGFCVVTFKEHIAPVTGVKFIGQGQGKAVLSSSLDGTVRAHDLLRYKNFRTLSAPTSVQFTSLAADPSGEVVCAGSLDPFQIYVWALQTGKLLEVLSGHEGPIACLAFSAQTSVLASGSWDGTLKLWDVYQNHCIETFEHGCDILAVAFRPDGKEVCCSATNGNIYFWDVDGGEQVALIEGRRDIAGGRLTTDATTAENSARSKFFNSLAYSADGTCILAGGRSKYLCIYSIQNGTLVKKFQLSHNHSLEGIVDKLRSDRIVDGVQMDNLPFNEGDSENERKRLMGKGMPGGGKSSLTDGSRTVKPELLTAALMFSPTGREYAVASTQGLQIFGLDDGLMFAPIDLDVAITPQTVAAAAANGDYSAAITMAVHLGEIDLLKKVIESVELESIDLVAKTIDIRILKDLFRFLAEELVSCV